MGNYMINRMVGRISCLGECLVHPLLPLNSRRLLTSVYRSREQNRSHFGYELRHSVTVVYTAPAHDRACTRLSCEGDFTLSHFGNYRKRCESACETASLFFLHGTSHHYFGAKLFYASLWNIRWISIIRFKEISRALVDTSPYSL